MIFTTSKKIICDSDFLISLLLETESTSEAADEVFEKIKNQNILYLELVHFEFATVLSRKIPPQSTHKALQKFEQMDAEKVILEEEDIQKVWKIFFSYEKKNISFIDCANLYTAEKIGAKIASFDRFYPKKYLV